MFLPKPTNTLVVCLVLIFLFISTCHLSSQNDGNEIQRVRISFTSNGFVRPLLLGFTPDNAATNGFDYGYDALYMDVYPNDMFWMIEGQQCVIQGVGNYDDTMILSLGVFVANAGPIAISLTGLENFDSDIDVYIYDALLNATTQINTTSFQVTLDANTYMDRFYLAFASDDTLFVDELIASTVYVNFLNASNEIYVKMPDISTIERVHLYNIIGQSIQIWDNRDFDTFNNEIRIPVENIPEGYYVIKLEGNSTSINKKILIKS